MPNIRDVPQARWQQRQRALALLLSDVSQCVRRADTLGESRPIVKSLSKVSRKRDVGQVFGHVGVRGGDDRLSLHFEPRPPASGFHLQG